MQGVPHSFLFGVQVTLVVFVGSYLDGHVFGYFEPVCLEPDPFHRVVGKKAHFVYSYFAQNLGTYAIVALVSLMAEADICVNSIHSFFLKFIGFHFFH